MSNVSPYLIPPEVPPFDLHDDGLGGDCVAGDSVFTGGPFSYNTSLPMPDFYQNDSASPAGLFNVEVGTISIEELDGTVTTFLIDPAIGLLKSDVPETGFAVVAPDVAVSPHLINIRSDARETQRLLRLAGGDLRNLTNALYQVLPDAIHFFVFFSTDKIELLPRTSSPNFIAGIHLQVQVNFTGTGLGLFDSTASFGSDGTLLGINVLDAYERGIRSGNATHEIVHQWASFISTSLGLSQGAHYKARSSVASLVGGFRWIDNGDGSFSRDCTEGRNGAHHAPPLDKYMMGLIDGNAVAPLYVSNPAGSLDCGQIISGPYTTVTVDDIQAVHGIRSPGPGQAQRDFNIAFVAESYNRFLNLTEMTYYEILAEHYTKPIPPGDPDPYVGFNWASIDRFFGEGTTFSTVIPPLDGHDCNSNGTLDEYEIATNPNLDCNTNAILDECDISAGTSRDDNSNGIPDECEGVISCPCIYDLDGNCTVGGGDFGLFAGCWMSPETGPGEPCEFMDFDCNGTIAGGDFGLFAGAWMSPCDELDASAYASCWVCIGPVVCPWPSCSARGVFDDEATTGRSLQTEQALKPAGDGVVELSVHLTRQPGPEEGLDRLGHGALGRIKVGEHIFTEVWVKDRTAGSRGLAAVFTDVSFDPTQFKVVGVEAGETFTLFAQPSFEENIGVVSGVGGATLEPNHGAGHWARVAVVELEARAKVARPSVSVRPTAVEPISGIGRGLFPANEVQVVNQRPGVQNTRQAYSQPVGGDTPQDR